MGPVTAALVLQGAFAVLLAFGWRTAAPRHRRHPASSPTASAAPSPRPPASRSPPGCSPSSPGPPPPTPPAGAPSPCSGPPRCSAGSSCAWRRGGRRARPGEAASTPMLLFAAGSALAVPTPLTVAGLLLAGAGIVAQVLRVEEPHLRRQHGPAYDAYLARTGRFLPALAKAAP